MTRGESRTAKSVRNVKTAMGYYVVNLVLTFFSRKVFIDHLGAEVLGLNTAATNLLGFLSLAELGIGGAVAFSLYRPLAEGDREQVRGIVSVQGWFYRRIALFILGASAVLMCFFSWFFAKADVPGWYIYATFIVMLCSSMAGYFFNYRQVLVTADQRDHRLTRIYRNVRTAKVLSQIAAIVWLPYGYVWWLGLELAGATAVTLGIERLIRRDYPWLKTDVALGGRLRHAYPQIMTRTKQLFFHKIGGFALSQTSPLIIYAYASLTTVAMYGNYIVIVSGLTQLVAAMSNSLTAGVGNLIAECDRDKALRFFGELFSSRFLVACTACCCMWLLAPAFIGLWVGREYLLDQVTLAIIVATLYVGLSRGAVDIYINASGLFHDVWAPIAEAALNVGLSILLGWFFGLPGILGGVLASQVLVVKLWKPYFLFRHTLRTPVMHYVKMYGVHLAALALALAVFVPLIGLVAIDPSRSYGWLALYALIAGGMFGAILYGWLYAFCGGMRDFTDRMLKIVKK